MEDAQEKAFTKRKRSEEEFEETQEHVQECQARASALDLKINQFTELLQLVTARDRRKTTRDFLDQPFRDSSQNGVAIMS